MTQDIEQLLMMRRAVDVPPGLAQRIINMAQPRTRKSDSWADIWADIQTMFVIPRPAYALAMAIFLGLFIGMGNTVVSGDVSTPMDLASFLSVDNGDLDNGDWL